MVTQHVRGPHARARAVASRLPCQGCRLATRSGGAAYGGGGDGTRARQPAFPRQRPPDPPSAARQHPSWVAACRAADHMQQGRAVAAVAAAAGCRALAAQPSRRGRQAGRPGRGWWLVAGHRAAAVVAHRMPSGGAAGAAATAACLAEQLRAAAGTRLDRLLGRPATAGVGRTRRTVRRASAAPMDSPRRLQAAAERERRRQRSWRRRVFVKYCWVEESEVREPRAAQRGEPRLFAAAQHAGCQLVARSRAGTAVNKRSVALGLLR